MENEKTLIELKKELKEERDRVVNTEIAEALDTIKIAVTRDVLGEPLSKDEEYENTLLALKIIGAIPTPIKIKGDTRQLMWRDARMTVKVVEDVYFILQSRYKTLAKERKIKA